MNGGFLYIMASETRTIYIGVTNSLERRTERHQRAEIGGFTKRYALDRLVYWEQYDDIRDAIAREKQLKGWRRSRKNALIQALNPNWDDLSAHLFDPSASQKDTPEVILTEAERSRRIGSEGAPMTHDLWTSLGMTPAHG